MKEGSKEAIASIVPAYRCLVRVLTDGTDPLHSKNICTNVCTPDPAKLEMSFKAIRPAAIQFAWAATDEAMNAEFLMRSP